MHFKSLFAGVVSLAALPSVLAAAGQIVRINEDFGPNPTNVSFWIYVPANVQSNPPILVNPHWCTGTAQAVFTGTQLANQADVYGYIMIFPEADRSSKCWDVSSPGTLKHDGGGDSQGIASMVKWTLKKYNGNANRVFSMGTSSGAMMTNVLLGSYPDLFAGGSAWAGVAFGCFVGTGIADWNSDCAQGLTIKTGAEWKAIVEAAYPGYNGWRPKMQSVHGSVDDVVKPQNLQEQIKEWTAVLGYSETPVQTFPNSPNANWTTFIYGEKFQAISAAGVGHDVQTNADTVLDFFDLKCTGTGCFGRPSGGVSSSTARTTTGGIQTRTTLAVTTSPPRSTTTTAAASTTVPEKPVQTKWGQCGGTGYTGPTVCASGSTCKFSNQWFSQCL